MNSIWQPRAFIGGERVLPQEGQYNRTIKRPTNNSKASGHQFLLYLENAMSMCTRWCSADTKDFPLASTSSATAPFPTTYQTFSQIQTTLSQNMHPEKSHQYWKADSLTCGDAGRFARHVLFSQIEG